MLSLQKNQTKVDNENQFNQMMGPLKNIEKNFSESLMIENESHLIKPWEPESTFSNFMSKSFAPSIRSDCRDFHVPHRDGKINNPLELVDPIELVDPSGFELYKENDVLYPTLATLPHVDLDCPVRLSVMGAKEVGKSALAVRYLSGQQTTPNTEAKPAVSNLRRPRLSASQGVEVDIIDVPFKTLQEDKNWMDRYVQRDQEFASKSSANVIVVMYSITDRGSFHIAGEILESLRNGGSKDPILLLANKSDLSHLRQVCLTEGRNMSRQFDAAFQEVSVANCPDQAIDVLNKLIKHLREAKKQKEQGAIAMERSQSLCSNGQEPDSNLPELLPMDASQERTRKFSVFNAAGRMLNHLLLFGSRNSMPPELPSSAPAGTVSRFESSAGNPHHDHHGHYSDNFSFKNVFKKRSV